MFLFPANIFQLRFVSCFRVSAVTGRTVLLSSVQFYARGGCTKRLGERGVWVDLSGA